jgi:hypothetical protein
MTEAQREAQRLGYEWEEIVAVEFDADLQTGSGNRVFAPLDVSGKRFLISAKNTVHQSFSLTKKVFDEAVEKVLGTKAAGGTDTIPLICIRLSDGTRIAALPMDDLIDMMKAPPELIEATKIENIRHTARTSSLLR